MKFAGVSQTGKPISAGPKFTILWRHVEDILLLNKFFFRLSIRALIYYEDIARQNCAMVPTWRFLATFLRPVFSASRMQHVSDLHLKFALRPKILDSLDYLISLLRPHHVWKKPQHANIMVCPIP